MSQKMHTTFYYFYTAIIYMITMAISNFKILTTKEHVGKSETLPMSIFTFCLVIIGQNQPAPNVDVLVVNPFENQSQEDKS